MTTLRGCATQKWTIKGPGTEPRASASCERIGWQAKAPAKAPAPQKRKPLCTKVGQTLWSVNPANSAIFSQLLSERPPRGLERSEEHTSELQSLRHLVCRLLLEK